MTKETDEIPSNLEELKKEYKSLQSQFSLPSFTELNQQFDIEEISIETQFLLRKIRRTITEKLNGYLRFIELLLNPSSAPMFFFNLVKKIDSNDKETLSKLYETLGNLETKAIPLDIDYNEKQEAEYIINSQQTFNNEIKPQLLEISKKLMNGKSNNVKQNNGSYFG
tara:strand:- start:1 stop:501 length:501 start_codon:yes stop_codon:yes gene_type:complete